MTNTTPSPKIEVINAQERVAISEDFIKKLGQFLKKVASNEADLRTYKTINVILVDNDYIANLNRRYLGRSGATDVLAFPLDDVGEIYVSVEFGVENIVHYALHGLLHLAGYDHKIPKDEKLMRLKEQSYLKMWP